MANLHEKHQRILADMLREDANRVCADCGSRGTHCVCACVVVFVCACRLLRWAVRVRQCGRTVLYVSPSIVISTIVRARADLAR